MDEEGMKDRIINDFAANLIRLGNECRDHALEVKRLKAENESLTALIESNLNSSKVMMGKADAVLHERDNLKAEVERLESDLKLEKENEDRLVRLWQTANNEVHGQRSQIAALIDNQTSLKAEVERLRKAGDDMAFHYQELVRIEWGSMTTHIPPSAVRWNAAKEGKGL